MNSKIFESMEADVYYERNASNENRFIADHILSLFPKKVLSNYDVAEFGIGRGMNLYLLSNYVKSVHGYDVSEKAIAHFKDMFGDANRSKCFGKRVNLCDQFDTPIRYDLVIYGWFAYYVADAELDNAKANLMKCIKSGAYVFVNDFLARNCVSKTDKRNNNLNVYKRNLTFWINYFHEFDLVDFRLFDCGHYFGYRNQDCLGIIDTDLTRNDEEWLFNGVFRLRT